MRAIGAGMSGEVSSTVTCASHEAARMAEVTIASTPRRVLDALEEGSIHASFLGRTSLTGLVPKSRSADHPKEASIWSRVAIKTAAKARNGRREPSSGLGKERSLATEPARMLDRVRGDAGSRSTFRRSALVAVVALIGAACGAILDVPSDIDFGDARDADARADGDGMPDGDLDAGADAADAMRRCKWEEPFGPATLLLDQQRMEVASDEAPRLSADELTLIFGRNEDPQAGPQNAQVWVARRNSIRELFAEPKLWFSFDGGSRDPMLSADGWTLYFTTGAADDGDIYAVVRDDDAGFDAASAVPVLATAEEEHQAFASTSGSELFFSARRAGSSTNDLYVAWLAIDGGGRTASKEKKLLGGLSTGKPDLWPVLSYDGTGLYFASRGDAGQEIRRTRRLGTDASFNAGFEVVAELNDDAGDTFPGWLSPDECRIYFWRRSISGPIDGRLWVAERAPP